MIELIIRSSQLSLNINNNIIMWVMCMLHSRHIISYDINISATVDLNHYGYFTVGYIVDIAIKISDTNIYLFIALLKMERWCISKRAKC